LGLGDDGRPLELLRTPATLTPHPESVPVNILAKVPGTPMAHNEDVPFTDTLRMIATARILMPKSVVRLSAGRVKLSTAEQALCFLAGANSIFSSDTRQMLTAAAPSPDYDADKAMLDLLLAARRPAAPQILKSNVVVAAKSARLHPVLPGAIRPHVLMAIPAALRETNRTKARRETLADERGDVGANGSRRHSPPPVDTARSTPVRRPHR
jgi:hypothetical protein